MKTELINELGKIAIKDKKTVFLTGDLGFNALEAISGKMHERFINAGVAEQNMISVAAGLAYTGLKVWVYSISSFLTLKTVEQVRNDVCLLNIPVKLVGFGGGYGYGVMGESHHLLEDLAIYSSFPNIKIYAPAFLEDIPSVVALMNEAQSPTYLRMNLAPATVKKPPVYSSIRQLSRGEKITIIVLGVLAHNVLTALSKIGEKNIADVFLICEFPFSLSKKVLNSISKNKNLLIVEEHTEAGGLGEKVFAALGKKNIKLASFKHLYAKGYPSGKYGNHFFHLHENELDADGILKNIKRILR